MKTNQTGNPDTQRFRVTRIPCEKALPDIPFSARPGYWEVVDRIAYAEDNTDTLGFVREGFRTKREAIEWIKSRRARHGNGTRSILTLG